MYRTATARPEVANAHRDRAEFVQRVEASTKPDRALPYADRLGALMPGAGHVVHMPFHIYYRVGRYKDSLAANRAAVEVDGILVI